PFRLAGSGQNVLGQGRCGPAHVVDVHAVEPGSQHAPHTRCAERQHGVKPVLDLPLVALQGQQFLVGGRIVLELLKPSLVLLLVTHASSPLSICVSAAKWPRSCRMIAATTDRDSASPVCSINAP